MKTALRTTGENATQEKLDALISLAVSQERRDLDDKYEKRVRHFFHCIFNLKSTNRERGPLFTELNVLHFLIVSAVVCERNVTRYLVVRYRVYASSFVRSAVKK